MNRDIEKGIKMEKVIMQPLTRSNQIKLAYKQKIPISRSIISNPHFPILGFIKKLYQVYPITRIQSFTDLTLISHAKWTKFYLKTNQNVTCPKFGLPDNHAEY